MNAKELFKVKLNEAAGDIDDPTRGNPPGVPPEGREYPPMPRERPRPMRRPPGNDDFMDGPNSPRYSEFGVPGDMERMMGRGGPGGAPRGQFSPKETSQLKDVSIMILATLANSDIDKEIGQALMSGQEIPPGHLQHILDEVRNIKLPPEHDALLEKIYMQLKKK